MQLSPQEYFTIFRLLDDHTDTNRDAYYVRAVLRNARTSDLLSTVDLDSKGGGEYSKVWQVPADTSGEGFYIKMVTSVYTDAGYTTKSANYGDEGTEFLVQDRQKVIGGGGSVDYGSIRKLVKDELSAAPTVKSTLDGINAALTDIETSLSNLATFVMANAGESGTSITSVADMLGELRDAMLTKVEEVNKAIKEIVIPEPEHVDLEPLKKAVGEVNTTIERFDPDNLKKRSEDSFERIKDFFTKDINTITGKIDDISGQLSGINCLVLEPQGSGGKPMAKKPAGNSPSPKQQEEPLNPGRGINLAA